VVLLLAAAEPAALAATARGEAAGDEANRAAVKQRDVDLSARGQVASGRDETRPGEQPRSVVDRSGFDDPVQVEVDTRAQHEHVSEQRHSACRLRRAPRARSWP
jgi:hypothetical protein